MGHAMYELTLKRSLIEQDPNANSAATLCSHVVSGHLRPSPHNSFFFLSLAASSVEDLDFPCSPNGGGKSPNVRRGLVVVEARSRTESWRCPNGTQRAIVRYIKNGSWFRTGGGKTDHKRRIITTRIDSPKKLFSNCETGSVDDKSSIWPGVE